MSNATATIAFRVKPEIKRRADALFERLGMSTSAGMNVLLMQTLEHRGFPFNIVVREDSETPCSRVRKTLDNILNGSEQLHGSFTNGTDLVAAALKE